MSPQSLSVTQCSCGTTLWGRFHVLPGSPSKETLESLFGVDFLDPMEDLHAELRTQNSEYLFAALIHHSILQRTTDTTCGPRATCGNH